MAKSKQSIMNMTPQELLKMFVAAVGELIKAESETLKTVLMAEIKASEKRIRDDMVTKDDVKRLEQKLDTKVNDHEKRIGQVEDQLSTHKN
jgi:hypothetical protein